jgi:pimeloyl-ACP methyl ester carboxylesterase
MYPPVHLAESLIFVLINGTWAENASWTAPQSTFAQYLQHNVAGSVTVTFRWNGRNSQLARREAGRRLADLIKRVHSASPLAKIILIGHSHGGSVAALSLGYLEEPSRHCVRIVFIGTPFLRYSPLDLDPASDVFAIGGISLVPLLVLVVSSWYFAATGDASGDAILSPFLPLSARMFLMFLCTFIALYAAISLFLLTPLLRCVLRRWLGVLQDKWLFYNLPIDLDCQDALVVYTRGDEAQIWLSRLLLLPFPIFLLFSVIKRRVSALFFLSPLLMVVSFSVAGVFPIAAVLLMLTLLMPVLCGLFSVAVMFAALVLGVITGGATIGLKACGVCAFQIMSVRVSTIPEYPKGVIQEKVLDISARRFSLRHSQLYRDPRVFAAIVAWVQNAVMNSVDRG